ncbi:MAG: transposase [Chloroflexi bacterium]|nr:transposase [Chloroflexota bacterium]
MRGRHDPQATMLAFVDLEERVPNDHPLRIIKAVADEALDRLSPEFDRMYSKVGRASVPPERLLKASLLISLYSVRSERAFCEELEYNLSVLSARITSLPSIGFYPLLRREGSRWPPATGRPPPLSGDRGSRRCRLYHREPCS